MFKLIIKPLWITSLRLVWLGLWLFGLGILLWLPMRRWPGDVFWPVQIGNYLMPWLLLGLIPGLLIAVLMRRTWLALVLAAPTVFILANYAPLFLPRSNLVLAGSEHVKVMSFNVWWRNQNLDRAINIIRQENPDILLLQEVTPDFVDKIRTGWAADLPSGQLNVVADGMLRQAVISRYPLELIKGAYGEGRVLKVKVNTPGGSMQVWNVHLKQPIFWREHRWQVTTLINDSQHVSGPLILGGDFNTTDQSEMYRLISRHLHNAHWEAGWGFGFSFPAHGPTVKGVPILTPLIRIDHLFYNDYLFAHNAQTVTKFGGSDHYPVVAEFSLIKK